MKVRLTRTERSILGLCEVFYHMQYVKLKHNAVHWMFYLLSRKGMPFGRYHYVEVANCPYSAELEADLKALDEKQDDIMDFYDAELTVHAVPATYLATAECVREVLEFDYVSNVLDWVETLASLSFMAEHDFGSKNKVVLCNRYIMMMPKVEYTTVKNAWRVLENAKMTF